MNTIILIFAPGANLPSKLIGLPEARLQETALAMIRQSILMRLPKGHHRVKNRPNPSFFLPAADVPKLVGWANGHWYHRQKSRATKVKY